MPGRVTADKKFAMDNICHFINSTGPPSTAVSSCPWGDRRRETPRPGPALDSGAGAHCRGDQRHRYSLASGGSGESEKGELVITEAHYLARTCGVMETLGSSDWRGDIERFMIISAETTYTQGDYAPVTSAFRYMAVPTT